MLADEHNPDQRPSSGGPGPRGEAFEAGRNRGIKDGTEWARHRAVTADLRRMCDQPEQSPVSAEELSELLQKYRNDPRCLATAAGHDVEPFREGYGIGFQRGACSVWSRLRELAADLDRLL